VHRPFFNDNPRQVRYRTPPIIRYKSVTQRQPKVTVAQTARGPMDPACDMVDSEVFGNNCVRLRGP